ncbi:MAG TPA: NusA-like transcription termination signal-binding factor [Methanocorpusculum sp.]|nr:NusA-like transcription termination signal-binding factor [Methanocorpusculum sp.]
MERSLGFKERRYIEELRIITKSTALDCVIDDKFERIIYIIKQGNMGLAIGRNGDNIRKLSGILGKRIEMVEYDEDALTFITNMFKPAQLSAVSLTPARIDVQTGDKDNLALAIGRNGATIEKAKILVKRFFNIDEIEVSAKTESS